MNEVVRPNVAVSKLLSPYRLGALDLPNRIVMAPMTRNRAGAGPRARAPLMATTTPSAPRAGLIVTEATQVSPQGGAIRARRASTTPEQIDGLAQGDRRRACRGRADLPAALACRAHLAHAAPAGRRAAGRALGHRRRRARPARRRLADVPTPRALATDEIAGRRGQFAQAPRKASAAGFDGVEIHGANGYLIDQFLRDGTNQRDDDYGGSVENRAAAPARGDRGRRRRRGADRVGMRHLAGDAGERRSATAIRRRCSTT